MNQISRTIAFLCTILFFAAESNAQVDLKHALPDLLKSYAQASDAKMKAGYALTIGNFYLYNKGYPLALDSAVIYCKQAEMLMKQVSDAQQTDDAKLLNARIWIARKMPASAEKYFNDANIKLKARLSLLLGRYYLVKDGSDKQDMSMAKRYFDMAQSYAKTANNPSLLISAMIERYKLLKENGTATDSCENYFNSILATCNKYRKGLLAAHAWINRAYYADNADLKIRYFEESKAAAFKAGDKAFYAFSLKEIADVNLQKGELEVAEKRLQDVLTIYKQIDYKNLQFTYDLLISTLSKKGEYEAAMRYGLRAVHYAEKTGTELGLSFFEYRLARLCEYLGQRDESLLWAKKCLKSFERDTYYPYGVYFKVERENITPLKASGVLVRLKQLMRKHPIIAPDQSFAVALIKAECYTALNKPAEAKKNFAYATEIIKLATVNSSPYIILTQGMADSYIHLGQYENARPFVAMLLRAPQAMIDKANQATIQEQQFKIDSAAGNYVTAIKHFEKAKAIRDSIFNHTRLKQTEELQIQFKTAQKDHENLVLRNRNTLQQSELTKSTLQKKLYLTVLLACILILGLMFYLYVAKQRNNYLLKHQRDEINDQNKQLNQLLREKEWLIKEVHHRVKNNLQIVTSLLNTQTAYLQNTEAYNAIRDSQNRMQAISIVHQKLYQSNDLAKVNFRVYVHELIMSIYESFESKINFEIDITDIYLDSAQLVPIGLILNEAITNCIKYAFEGVKNPLILISLSVNCKSDYKLVIKDNGIGLPASFDPETHTSLGITMMRGLVEQLSGSFNIYSDNGTVISIDFKRIPKTADLNYV